MGQEQSTNLSEEEIKQLEHKVEEEKQSFQEKKKQILKEAVEEERIENRKILEEFPDLELNESQKKKLQSLPSDLLLVFIKKYKKITKECDHFRSQLIHEALLKTKEEQDKKSQEKKLSQLSEKSKKNVQQKLEKEKQIFQEKKKSFQEQIKHQHNLLNP